MTERPPIGLVSVVVPVRNGAATIAEQLEALTAQTYAGTWNVLVVDNGSTDGTADVVRRFCGRLPGLRVLRASEGRGVAYARNVGADAGGDLIAICDADDVVDPGWLAAIVAAAASADVVGGRLDHEALNDPVAASWRGGADTALPVALGFLPYAIGANVAVRRTVWEAVGGWREHYRSSEDVEFSWRVQLTGYRLAFAPDAVVRYRHRPDIGASARQVYGYARATTRLHAEYRGEGARARRPREIAAGLGWLVTRAPFLALGRARRGIWVLRAAEQAGYVAGSVRHRVVCL